VLGFREPVRRKGHLVERAGWYRSEAESREGETKDFQGRSSLGFVLPGRSAKIVRGITEKPRFGRMRLFCGVAPPEPLDSTAPARLEPAGKERRLTATPPKVLLVFPRFTATSFWSFGASCEATGARAACPPLGLITLAALLPQSWDLRLVNRNVEDLHDADLLWADLVMTGGMLPQQPDTLAIIGRCKELGKPACVGGPDPTSSPHIYAAADFLVLGEAEAIIDTFVASWERGERSGRFQAERFTADVTKSPVPRFDLLRFEHYLFVGIQFSRGCPFNCEFCDIIELYGRVPRTKTNAQMLAEIARLYELGYRGHLDFVDDNFIGNKKALKRFLPVLTAWQKKRHYPFRFSTEASLNLADDQELLAMMREANFFAVFVGIESSNTDTLVAAQKKQNAWRSMEESVFAIYAAGIYVLAGFIVGFDTDTSAASDDMVGCIETTSIPVCMVGLLTALPNTQMTRRLEREGRLYPDYDSYDSGKSGQGDQCTGGINFVPLRPKRDILVDYKRVLERIYTPEAYFKRVDVVGRALERPYLGQKRRPSYVAKDLRTLARVMWKMSTSDPAHARSFWGLVAGTLLRNPLAFEAVLTMVVIYLHVGPFAQHVISVLDQQIAAIDSGEEPERIPLPRVAAE
jgi:radical SAM superfamily enzyme YgiQ (UPF0313 family)